MNTNILQKAKNLYANTDSLCLTVPDMLFSDAESKAYQSALKQRTGFLKFHEYMFRQTDADIQLMEKGYKKIVYETIKAGDNDKYLDMYLVKDAIDYHQILRDDSNFDAAICAEIVQRWDEHVELSKEVDSINSETLIELSENLKK